MRSPTDGFVSYECEMGMGIFLNASGIGDVVAWLGNGH